MPRFKVTIRKEFDIVVEAKNKEEADQAANELLPFGKFSGELDHTWDTGEWEVDPAFKTTEEADHGVVDGQIVAIEDWKEAQKKATEVK